MTAAANYRSVIYLLIWVGGLSALAANKENVTISVADGTTDHGDPSILCTPTKWTDLIIFYLGNYVAHAATTVTVPGESPGDRIVAIFCSLFFPSSGAVRAIQAITSFAVFGKNDLQTAARAGALFTVIKTPQEEETGWPTREAPHTAVQEAFATSVGPDFFGSRQGLPVVERASSQYSIINWLGSRRLHGSADYLEGHSLVVVPPNAEFEDLDEGEFGWRMVQSTISSNYNVVKSLVALVQTLYAASTLYKTRGNQIELFGYAAFGLTVTPYVAMSALNLIASLICPEYPTLILVESPDMVRAHANHGYKYKGAVGCLKGCDEAREAVARPTNENAEAEPVQAADQNENVDREPQDTITEHDQQEHADISPPLALTLEEPNTRAATQSTGGLDQNHHEGDTQDIELQQLPDQKEGRAQDRDQEAGDPAREQRLSRRPSALAAMAHAFAQTNAMRTQYRLGSSVLLPMLLTYGFIALPLAVVAGLTHFNPASSTRPQRVWTMVWLIFGVVFGLLGIPQDVFVNEESRSLVGGLAIYAAPAVGGFVVVGQMLNGYGICEEVS